MVSSAPSGLDSWLTSGVPWRNRRWALLSNSAVTDAVRRPILNVLTPELGKPAALFGPQHGWLLNEQDNMMETASARHPEFDVPVYSLYSDLREPTAEMLDGLDVIIMDLPDVGTRVYTYIATMAYLAKAALNRGIEIVVLDRPNPIGRAVEGNRTEPGRESFVGLFPWSMRHGLTVGEMLLWAMKHWKVDSSGLSVVPFAADCQPLWLDMPSPNMPAQSTARVYPGGVLTEGLRLSEGRGTTRPFEMIGFPGVQALVWIDATRQFWPELETGAALRPVTFRPTFHKFAGEVVSGVFVHVTDPNRFQPYRVYLSLLKCLAAQAPEAILDREDVYEYEPDRAAFEVVTGTDWLRHWLSNPGSTYDELDDFLQREEAAFAAARTPFLLYTLHPEA